MNSLLNDENLCIDLQKDLTNKIQIENNPPIVGKKK